MKTSRSFSRNHSVGLGIVVSLAMLTVSACGQAPGGTSSTPPQKMTYSESPANYTIDTEITPNELTAEGGVRTARIAPALPEGLVFDSENGTISGTPTVITEATDYTVTVTNGNGSNFTKLHLAVNDVPPTIEYEGETTLDLQVGTAMTAIIPTLGGGATLDCVALPPLPLGLTLSADCQLSGTPLEPKETAVYIIAPVNSGGAGSLPVTMTIIDLPPTLAYDGSPLTYHRGVAISALSPTNTGGAITSCVSDPALPAGVSLGTDCVISGTPTATSAAANYLITATNSGGTANMTLNLQVNDLQPAISFSNIPMIFTKGTEIATVSPTSTGGAIDSCEVVPALPSGLAVSTDCQISGTPAEVVSATEYMLTATNPAGSSSDSVTLSVKDLPPIIAYGAGPFVYTNHVANGSLVPTSTGGAITDCDVSPTLPSGLSLSYDCVISGVPGVKAALKTYSITASNSGGSYAKNIQIVVNETPPVMSYSDSPFTFHKAVSVAALAPTNTGGPITSCTSLPPLPAGLNLASNCTVSGVPITITDSAEYVITGTNEAGSSSATVTMVVTDTPPSISYAGSPFIFTHDVAITTTAPANTGGTITSCSSSPVLPAGLSLSNVCVISGTPTVLLTTQNYMITGENAGGTSSAVISIAVKDPAPGISYVGSPFSFGRNVAIATQAPVNTGGAIDSCSSSPALPAGLTISNVCEISGTPSAFSTSTAYVITATNTGGTSSVSITIAVVDAAPVISYSPSTYVYTKNSAITEVVVSSSGGTITSCTSVPTLPAGLSLSATCGISGTPSVASATAAYQITAVNTGGSSSASLTITVNDVVPAITYAGSPFTYTRGTTIFELLPTNTGGSITSCSVTPNLPGGLTLSNACVVSGTPTTVSAATDYTITAMNAGGASSATIRIQVKDKAKILFYGTTALDGTFNGTAAGYQNAWSISIDGTENIPLTRNSTAGGDSLYPVFSPTGNEVAYFSKRALNGEFDIAGALSFNLWKSAVDGTGAAHRTANVAISLDAGSVPVFSPDGSKIAFISKTALDGSNDGTPTLSYNLWVVNTDGTGKTALTSNTLAGYDSQDPVFSPNGTTVYFASKTALDGSADGAATLSFNIWKVNTNGTGKVHLTSELLADRNCVEPSVAPSGASVVYASRSELVGVPVGSYNIWKVGSDGTGATALTSNIETQLDSRTPSFSPDATKIVFSSLMDVGGASALSSNIWKMNSDGSSQTALTLNNGTNLDSETPSFSPDGAKIVFSSQMNIDAVTSNSKNIWIMNSDGTGADALTTNTASSLDSYLSPHSAWFVP